MTERVVAELPVSDVRENFSNVVNRASYAGQATYITRHGRRIAAVVSVDDAEILELLASQDVLDSLRSSISGLPAAARVAVVKNAAEDMCCVASEDRKRRDAYAAMVMQLARPEVVYVNRERWNKLHRAGTACAGPIPTYEAYVHGGMTMTGYDYQSAVAAGLEFCRSCCRQEAGSA